jgi:uncharacterized membrane protein YoaK (UPF0700 family)
MLTRFQIVPLAVVLSVIAGYVDTAGFLCLHGLFTSHVTGNFVTLAASLLHGSQGALAKLMALPVFCVSIFGARLLQYRLGRWRASALIIFLSMEFVALAVSAALARLYAPFADADGVAAFATGMFLVIAMAFQNGLHRMHLSSTPPSTIMTGTTTQVMIDVADIVHGVPPEARSALNLRLSNMLLSIVAFALGCAFAALCYGGYKDGSLLVPPLMMLVALPVAFMRHSAKAS